jgi:uncharacterized protein (DUF849 family)
VQHDPVLLQACLNGACDREAHPRCPITPSDISADAIAAVAAGADSVHVHPRDRDGAQTLEAEDVAHTIAALRETTDAFVGVSTGAWIIEGPAERLRTVEAWRTLPDFASVNFHEAGAVELATMLLGREVGVEAGVWTADAAKVLGASGLAERCVRILIEPMEPVIEDAITTVDAIEAVLDGVAPEVPRLLHGHNATTWDLVAEAARRGYDTRIGIEDTARLPDGKIAPGNADLVRAALALYRETELQP